MINSKKGLVTHLVVFLLVAGLGLFLVLSGTLSADQTIKSERHYSFLENSVYQAQKDLLVYDGQIITLSNEALADLKRDISINDLGCSKFEESSLWNSQIGFCDLSLREKYLDLLDQKIIEQTKISTNLRWVDNRIVGKEREIQIIKSDPEETISYFQYEFNRGFNWGVPTRLLELEEVERQAKLLVVACQNSNNLKNCIDRQENNFVYWGCNRAKFKEESRHVIFCSKDIEFALNFIPTIPFAIEDITITQSNNQFEIHLPYDEAAQQFNLYITNADNLLAYTGAANNIFVLEGLDQFLDNKEITNELIETQCDNDNFEIEKPYLCNNELIYTVQYEPNQNYYFAATATYNNQESTIPFFTPVQ